MTLPDLVIDDLDLADEHTTQQAAALLVAGFAENWPASWPDQRTALQEVREMLVPGRICRAAVVGEKLVGWIGGIPAYDGNVWELHPLVVDPRWQGQGIGRALVDDFEAQVRARGAFTVMLGTDDESGMTTLSGVDLYDGLTEHIRTVRDVTGHPFVFYRRLGYTIVGVIPDANGPGKPDIIMAKRVFDPEEANG